MNVVCSDLEGVFVPEIWINVAEKTGIEELRLTTRDISDYDVLMRKRLAILDENNLKIQDIQKVIDTMDPLEDAAEFIDWVRSQTRLIILSDTFEQFAGPLMKKLGWPTLFCHTLSIAPDGRVTDYILRQKDAKRHAVEAMKSLNFNVIAMGDSYNDVSMLQAADTGIFFCPPDSIKDEFPDLPVTYKYDEIRAIIEPIIS
ncbi:MAG: bifunctional phosphoserine phosphatase/homoserine phosphotransferase ThrH [Desulfobacterales bacterium]|nr:bifunctional phosphoserine phosphatase/homoserine phosphotransferase ThrH [Desulfobacterales bacterium]